MKLHTWRDIISNELQQQYISSNIWQCSQAKLHWESAICDVEVIQCLTKQLGEQERLLLLYLLDNPILVPIEQHELIGKLKISLRLSGQQLLCSLLTLAELGIILLQNDSWRGSLWNMPFPIFYHWRSALKQSSLLWHICTNRLDFGSSYVEYMQRPLGKQLLQLLYTMHQLDLSYTKQGDWRKTTKSKLLAACSELQAAIGAYAFVDDECSKEDQALVLLLELAFALQLIEKHEHGIEINYGQLEKWLLLHEHDRERMHQQWVCECLLVTGSSARSICDLLGLSAGQWYRQEEPPQELYKWISLFQICGWISYTKQLEDGVTALYVSVRVFSSMSTYYFDIQSNGEVIILPECSYRQLWLLAYVAECIQEQEVSVYRLTLSKLQLAGHAGYTSEVCFAWLRESGDSELSLYVKQLEMSLNQHNASPHSKSHAAAPIEMALSTERTTLQLRVLTSWGKWMRVRNYIEHQSLLDQKSRQLIRQSITTYNGTSSWVSDYRSYHHSTSKELVQYAINNQLALYIKHHARELKFNPERLVQSGNEWVIEGTQHAVELQHTTHWQLNDWDGVKLHFST